MYTLNEEQILCVTGADSAFSATATEDSGSAFSATAGESMRNLPRSKDSKVSVSMSAGVPNRFGIQVGVDIGPRDVNQMLSELDNVIEGIKGLLP